VLGFSLIQFIKGVFRVNSLLLNKNKPSFYVGAIRTLNVKYQKFMTCLLVDNIYVKHTK